MLGIVIFAGDKGIEAAGKSINGGVKGRVILVGENYVEIAIELGTGEVFKVPTDKSEADEVALGAMAEDVPVNLSG